MAGSSPTSRTLDHYRREGFLCAVVEQYFKPPGVKFGWKRDLFAFGDILAIRPGEIIMIQATSGSNHSVRRDKITGEATRYEFDPKKLLKCYEATEGAREWLKAGGHIHIVSWSKKVHKLKSGKKSEHKRWAIRVEDVLEDIFVEIKKHGERGLVGRCENIGSQDPDVQPEFCLESLSLKTD